mgnify:CR=1 FL=1
MEKINLKDNWLLRWEELYTGPEGHHEICEKKDGWLKTAVASY